MEDLDQAAERSELERQQLVAAIRRRAPERVLPDGFCHFCSHELQFPRIFCGPECAEQYELERRRRR
jgi:hypothetical protein